MCETGVLPAAVRGREWLFFILIMCHCVLGLTGAGEGWGPGWKLTHRSQAAGRELERPSPSLGKNT